MPVGGCYGGRVRRPRGVAGNWRSGQASAEGKCCLKTGLDALFFAKKLVAAAYRRPGTSVIINEA